MRTAEEILIKYGWRKEDTAFIETCNIVNEARKEAIAECALKANLLVQGGYGTPQHKGTSMFSVENRIETTTPGHGDCSYQIIEVNKASILNLIDELK